MPDTGVADAVSGELAHPTVEPFCHQSPGRLAVFIDIDRAVLTGHPLDFAYRTSRELFSIDCVAEDCSGQRFDLGAIDDGRINLFDLASMTGIRIIDPEMALQTLLRAISRWVSRQDPSDKRFVRGANRVRILASRAMSRPGVVAINHGIHFFVLDFQGDPSKRTVTYLAAGSTSLEWGVAKCS